VNDNNSKILIVRTSLGLDYVIANKRVYRGIVWMPNNNKRRDKTPILVGSSAGIGASAV
jgi:hypothetical protein